MHILVYAYPLFLNLLPCSKQTIAQILILRSLTLALITNFSSLEDRPRQRLAAHVTVGGGVDNYFGELVSPHINHILHTHTPSHNNTHSDVSQVHTLHLRKNKNKKTNGLALKMVFV